MDKAACNDLIYKAKKSSQGEKRSEPFFHSVINNNCHDINRYICENVSMSFEKRSPLLDSIENPSLAHKISIASIIVTDIYLLVDLLWSV
jgi:heat shock protein HspQ